MVALATLANTRKDCHVTEITDSKAIRCWPWRTLVAWIAVAAALWWVWPVEPRWTLRGLANNVAIEFIGNKPELVAFDYHKASIQIWNLETGSCRELSISGVSPSELRGVPISATLRGKLLKMIMLRLGTGHEPQTVIVDIETGIGRTFKFDTTWHVALSSTGRWAIEHSSISERRKKLRVVDMDTGEERLLIEGLELDGRFSDDDTLFACAIRDFGPNLTKIWNMNSGELVQVMSGYAQALNFSQSRRKAAAVCQVVDGNVERHELRAWDVGSENVAILGSDKLLSRIQDDQEIQFAENEDWVLCYEGTKSRFLGGDTSPDYSKLKRAWHPESGEVNIYDLKSVWMDGPLLCGTFMSSEDLKKEPLPGPPQFSVGRVVCSLPDDAEPIYGSPDGRLVVYQQHTSTAFGKVADWVRRRGHSMPAFLSSIPTVSTTASVISLPSGQHLGSIPDQPLTFDGERDTRVTPDGKLLATGSLSDTSAIDVWDLPIRKSSIKPLAWSLIVPAVSLLWSGWRRWRTRARTAA